MKQTPLTFLTLMVALSSTACSSLVSVDRSKIHDPLFDRPDASSGLQAGSGGSAGTAGRGDEDAGVSDDAGTSS